MKKFISLIFLIIFSQYLFSQDTYLSQWIGYWEGDLYIYSKGEIKDTVPSILTITKTDNPDVFIWKTVYKAPDKDIVKDYKMIAQDSIPNMYILDEGDGIELEVYKFGNKLYSVFEVQGNLLTSLYELKDNKLIFEIISGTKIDETEGLTNYSVSFMQKVSYRRKNQE